MRRVAFILGICLLPFLVCLEGRAQEDKESSSRIRPLVVMKQATIKGRVFLIAEDGEDAVADKLKVQVWTSDGKKKLQDTITDKEGSYALANLDVGEYRLIVGRLRLRLHVEETKTDSGSRLPKVIMVFIPQELGR